MIALVDCNAFFCSCERLFAPKYIHLPVVVLSNNDGLVISRTKEAKKLGIKMCDPHFKIKKFEKSSQLKIFSSNYKLYNNLSKRVIKVLEGYSSEVDVYSVDEAFLHINYLQTKSDLLHLGEEIKNKILKYVGIPVSVGFGPTKTLAKLATSVAKENKTGVCIITPNDRSILESMQIDEIWGIGRKLSIKYKLEKIFTPYHLMTIPSLSWLKKNFGKNGLTVYWELHGVKVHQISVQKNLRQSVMCSRTLAAPLSSYDLVKDILAKHIINATRKLRKEQLYAKEFTIFLRHEENFESRYSEESFSFKTVIIQSPSNSDAYFIKLGQQLLEQVFSEALSRGKKHFYKKIGVAFNSLSGELQLEQSNFLSCLSNSGQCNQQNKVEQIGQQRISCNKLSTVVDTINEKYGKSTLQFAICAKNRLSESERESNLKKYFDNLPIAN